MPGFEPTLRDVLPKFGGAQLRRACVERGVIPAATLPFGVASDATVARRLADAYVMALAPVHRWGAFISGVAACSPCKDARPKRREQ